MQQASIAAAVTQVRPLPASASVYHQEHRLPKWNGRVTAAGCHCHSTAGTLLRRMLPDWTKAQHLRQAAYHRARAKRLDAVWGKVWVRSFQEAFGRAPVFGEYHITAIGSEEIAEHHKRVLRHCAYQSTTHTKLARAHERAAGLRKLLESA